LAFEVGAPGFSRVYICIDGIDKILDELEDLLSHMARFLDTFKDSVRLFVTTRDTEKPLVEKHLPLSSCTNRLEDNCTEDIRRYILHRCGMAESGG
jgi:hypothetical protein